MSNQNTTGELAGRHRVAALVLIIALGLIGWKVWAMQQVIPSAPNDTVSTGRQICPEAWYENRMPAIDGFTGKQVHEPRMYFIVDGQNVEFTELDVTWVKKNCAVNKPEVVW